MIKILHTGDLHIGREYKKQQQEDETIARRYQMARLEALERVISLANEEQCDYLVIAGDLYDKKDISLSLQKDVCRILDGFWGTIFVLPGNHDYYEGEGDKLWSRFEANAGERVVLAKENKAIQFDDVCFYPCICHDRYSQDNALCWLMKGETCSFEAEKKSEIEEQSLEKEENAWAKKQASKEKEKEKATKGNEREEKERKRCVKIGVAHGALEGLSYDKERKYYYMTTKQLEQCDMDLWLLGHTHVPYPNEKAEEKIDGHTIFNAGTHQQTDLSDGSQGSVFLIEIETEENHLPEDEKVEADEKERRTEQEKDQQEKKNIQIYAKKILTGVIHFEKREIVLHHGEHLQEQIEQCIKEMDWEQTTLRLSISGTALQEDYEQRFAIYDIYEKKFLKLEIQDASLKPEITKEQIKRETIEHSTEYELLMKYLDEPELLNLAFDLVKSCKE